MEEVPNNAINNYKGVMLCSRPNEAKGQTLEKPFCGRVVNGNQVGLNPVRKEDHEQYKPKKNKLEVLEKHKKWLAEFHQTMQKNREKEEYQRVLDEKKVSKIKELAEIDRYRARKMKEEYNKTATNVLNVLDEKTPEQPTQTVYLNAYNLKKLDYQNEKNTNNAAKYGFKKKKYRPLWALTKYQAEYRQDQYVDDLVNFFYSTPVTTYSEDEYVKQILQKLHDKIVKIKEQENWKQKEEERIKDKKKDEQKEGEDDKYSTFSVRSEARSVASENTKKQIEYLRQKQQAQYYWDKHTTKSKTAANIEDRIAKNLADYVLRNYPNIKQIHSNNSIRKLLEAEAAKVLNYPIMRPVITTIVREKLPMNPNTLPWMHREMAI